MILTAKEIQHRRNCCHESGHTVAWVMNGDTVLLVVADPDAAMTTDQKELLAQAREAHRVVGGKGFAESTGCTVVHAKDRACPRCEGVITTHISSPLTVNFHLSAGCPTCMDLLANHAACICAGAAATSRLEHRTSLVDILNNACRTLSEAQHDRHEVDRILSGLIADQDRRDAIKDEAEHRAANWIQREWRAVSVLTEALFQAGALEGAHAIQLVIENLNH